MMTIIEPMEDRAGELLSWVVPFNAKSRVISTWFKVPSMVLESSLIPLLLVVYDGSL